MLVLSLILLLTPLPQQALVAAPQTSGSPRVCPGSPRAWDFSVSSLLGTSHISSPSVADVFDEVETQVAARGATFCPLGLGGVRREVSESRASLGVSVGLPRDTSPWIAQRISCTLHRARQRMALQGWLATRLMGLAGEVHGLPWLCGGSWFDLVWCATPSGVLSSRTVCHALAPIAFVPVFRVCLG